MNAGVTTGQLVEAIVGTVPEGTAFQWLYVRCNTQQMGWMKGWLPMHDSRGAILRKYAIGGSSQGAPHAASARPQTALIGLSARASHVNIFFIVRTLCCPTATPVVECPLGECCR